jgi:hypothetical protein
MILTKKCTNTNLSVSFMLRVSLLSLTHLVSSANDVVMGKWYQVLLRSKNRSKKTCPAIAKGVAAKQCMANRQGQTNNLYDVTIP